ncbi:phage antirepressor N-terminal domain-containing protein [Pseudomonas denitrificans (nom. rej.)]|nr:phage antirepressor N-terminal domain-containing protein [Pseudomonas denitrificans (nom. rej.)]
MNNATAISVKNNVQELTAQVVPFRQASLLLVDHGGVPFVPMKPVVEGMGLDWKSQHVKLNQGRFAATMVEITMVAADGKKREMSCLPLRKLAGWLVSIHPSKVRSELRDGVIAYQNECDDVLWKYWNNGIAVRRDDRTAVSVLSTTIGTDGFHCLAAVIDGKVRHLPRALQRGAKNHVWSQVRKAFSVSSVEDIPATSMDSARNFIAAYVVEGQFLGREEPAAAVDVCTWSNIAVLINNIEQSWKIMERTRLSHHLSSLGCKAGLEIASFLYDALGSAAHVKKHHAKDLDWQGSALA